MSGTTISTTLTNGVTLDNSPPLTITSTGAVFASTGPAIVDQTPPAGGEANHVYNYGQLLTTAPTYAVDLLTFFARDNLTNAGTITGPDGVTFYGQVLANSGTISATDVGIRFQGGSLINSGFIYGATAIFEPEEGNFLDNSGTISATSTGVTLQTGIFDNTGLIQAGATAVAEAGSGGNLATTLNTSGRIIGGTDAIYVQNGILDLNVSHGASFSGYVLDHTGNATLSLSGPGGSLDVGSSFIGFTQITFDAAATWSLEGAADDLASGQTISQFWGGDTLILDGFAATKASYVSGIGLELSNASAAVTLHTNAPLPGESFALTSHNGNSTIAVHGAARSLVSLVSAPQANQITPGAGNYATTITITPTGTIATGAAPAVYSSNTAHVTNDGSISSTGTVNNADLHSSYAVRNTTYLYNNGIIAGENGVYSSDVITNSGTILAPGYFGVRSVDILVNSGLISGGTFGIYAANEIVNSGTIAGNSDAITAGDLTLDVDPGAVFIGNVQASGDLNLERGATAGSLNIGSFDGFGQISFASGAPWTLEGTANQLATGQTITGFGGGDTIVLDSFAATSKIYAGGAELLLSDGVSTETLDIIGTLKTSDFTITDNAAGGTDISAGVACFVRGTRIATPRGNVAIEKLCVGDLVTTMHGDQPIRWIGRRAYAARFIAGNPDVLPIRIRRHAIALNVPSRDLYVSPDHAIAEGGVLIHAHLLQNGISITQPERVGDVEYFHLEFDTHTVILAENLSTESFINEGAGNRFQNSHTRPAAADAQKPCLPRVFEGFHLHNIKSRIAARAGILEPTTLGPLRGVIDECTPTLIRGWAQNSAAPEHPVTLEIISAGLSYMVLANAYRPDLRAAGLGSGCHGFSLSLPNLQHPVTVRRALDGATISGVGRKRAA